MQAVILLADSAQTDPAGKIHALGIGWSVTSTPTPPASLMIFLQIPWTAANSKHKLLIELLTADGHPVPSPDGPGQSMRIEGEFEVGRPPGLPAGMPLGQPLTIGLPVGLELTAGQMYEWRLSIDGTHEDPWSARFFVRPAGV
jgi:hypothetical protein